MKQSALICICLCLAVTASAQKIGNSVSFLSPVGDFGDTHTGGFGINANIEFDLPGPIDITGEAGWNKFYGEALDGADIPDVSAVSLLAGIKLGLPGPFYLEGRGGYYFGDYKEFVIIPAIGARLRRLDLNAGMQVLHDVKFLNFRVAFFWHEVKLFN